MHVERDGDRDKYIYIYIYIYIYGGGEIVIFGLVGPKSNLYTLFCGFCTRRRGGGRDYYFSVRQGRNWFVLRGGRRYIREDEIIHGLIAQV